MAMRNIQKRLQEKLLKLENNKYVRLVNAAGRWVLTPKNNKNTLVSYTWNGELLGDFPKFALERAWKMQGNEIIHWITDALE